MQQITSWYNFVYIETGSVSWSKHVLARSADCPTVRQRLILIVFSFTSLACQRNPATVGKQIDIAKG